jgi:ketosteroid isomerase-like protein
MREDLDDFQQFMKRRDDVARAYVRGDPAPLEQIVTHIQDATFFGPQGGHEQGAAKVAQAYRREAAAFEPGGDSKLEVLHGAASDGIAYWVGIQRARMRMRGHPEPVQIALRVTEVFQREGPEWKLVHRHADALAEPQKKT